MNQNEELCNRYFKNLMSLTDAIQEAGGRGVLDEEIKLREFLYICATNGIEITAKFNKPDTERNGDYFDIENYPEYNHS